MCPGTEMRAKGWIIFLHTINKDLQCSAYHADLVALCRSGSLTSSETHLDATMRVIYEAMVDLHKEQQRLQSLGVKVDRISCKHPFQSFESSTFIALYMPGISSFRYVCQ